MKPSVNVDSMENDEKTPSRNAPDNKQVLQSNSAKKDKIPISYPNGKTITTQIDSSARAMYSHVISKRSTLSNNDDIASSDALLRKQRVMILREILSRVEALESSQKYPNELRTNLGNLNLEDSTLIWNSPHRGNTVLQRLGDLQATQVFSTAIDGEVLELRTILDSNKLTDDIYLPTALYAFNKVLKFKEFGVPLESLEENLEKSPRVNSVKMNALLVNEDPFKLAVRHEPEAQVSLESLREQAELTSKMLTDVPTYQDYLDLAIDAVEAGSIHTLADFYRIWNIAVNKTLTCVMTGKEYAVVDIPLSSFNELTAVRNTFENSYHKINEYVLSFDPKQKEFQNRNEFVKFLNNSNSPQLAAEISGALLLYPDMAKSGRSMHNYWPHVMNILIENGIAKRELVPALFKMPDMSVANGIHTIESACADIKALARNFDNSVKNVRQSAAKAIRVGR